jgi:(p)ppGpp synthase/HD superfamily hydrolase
MKLKSGQIEEIEHKLRRGKIVKVEPLKRSSIKKEIQETSANILHLTARFTRAIDYARQVHVNYRKGTSVPYMAHLLGVASLVMGENGYVPFPVTEDMVIGALLHDAVEDEGGWPEQSRVEFGRNRYDGR